MNPLLPLEDVRTLDAVVGASLAQRRFGMLLLGFFAVSALALVVIGLYGVIAYGVAQRTHEIGVRSALGASRADVFRLIIGEGARVTGLGVVVGLAGAVALSRVLESVLYGVSAIDPLALAIVTALLVTVALVATGMPARRAMGVEPVEALRGE
jgi:ABC-type antimicrobial peptide transport system permease subunit